MPRNYGKGGKNRRKGKHLADETKRELPLKQEDEEYAQVTKLLGSGRLDAYCFDGKSRKCHIRGNMMKKQWINLGYIILVSKREYEPDKADVLLKFSAEEALALKKKGELPESTKVNEAEPGAEEDDIEFVKEEVKKQVKKVIESDSDSEEEKEVDLDKV